MLGVESVPIPLRHSNIDVVGSTNTTLDVLLETRKDDYCNVDGDRNLSEPWTGFTQFTKLNEKNLQTDTYDPGERVTKIQATKGKVAMGNRENRSSTRSSKKP